MKIVPVDESTLDKYVKNRRCNIEKLIDDFRDSKHSCVEVKDYPHKTADSCWNSIKYHLKHNKIYTVQLIRRGDRIFLVKKKI